MNSGIKTLEIELRQQYAGRALRKAPLPAPVPPLSLGLCGAQGPLPAFLALVGRRSLSRSVGRSVGQLIDVGGVVSERASEGAGGALQTCSAASEGVLVGAKRDYAISARAPRLAALRHCPQLRLHSSSRRHLTVARMKNNAQTNGVHKSIPPSSLL